MENLIKLLDVVIWPGVVLFIAIMIRKPIKALLPFLDKFKYKDLEIKFRADLDQITEDAKEAGIDLPAEIEGEIILKLAEISPSSAILESWKELESSARQKVEELIPRDANLKHVPQRPIAYLEHNGALIPSTARTLLKLKQLRNQTAHTSDMTITKQDAIEYASLSNAIKNQIEAIRELPRIKLTALTLLILEINRLIDSGNCTDITIEDAHTAIVEKRIIPFLSEAAQDSVSFSLYGPDGPYRDFVEYYHEEMHNLHCCHAGDERRKWGIENLGLCLLLAWTNEIIQQGAGWYPSNN